jgi:hypothetical protein
MNQWQDGLIGEEHETPDIKTFELLETRAGQPEGQLSPRVAASADSSPSAPSTLLISC